MQSTKQQPSEIVRIQQGLGEVLRQARQRRHLSRLELAERMGYRKPQRGAARIAAWEQGRDLPRGDRPAALEAALGLAESTLGMYVAAAHQVRWMLERDAARRRRWDLAAVHGQLRALARSAAALLRQLCTIRAHPDWFHARIAGAGVGVAYLGGGSLSLGELLELWQRGEFTVDSPCCPDAALRLYYAAGSPLSGRNTVAGFCAGCPGDRHLRLDRDPPFGTIFPPALRQRKESRQDRSLLILEDVLAKLSPAPPPQLPNPPATLLPRDPYQSDDCLLVDPGDGEPFEIWQGNPYGQQRSTAPRRRYRAFPGHLLAPDGTVAAWHRRVQPAAALAATVRQLRAAGDR